VTDDYDGDHVYEDDDDDVDKEVVRKLAHAVSRYQLFTGLRTRELQESWSANEDWVVTILVVLYKIDFFWWQIKFARTKQA
jgi:hypothetical protein